MILAPSKLRPLGRVVVVNVRGSLSGSVAIVCMLIVWPSFTFRGVIESRTGALFVFDMLNVTVVVSVAPAVSVTMMVLVSVTGVLV